MPNCRPWYLSCWETSWWMDYVCSVFMNLSGDPDNLRLVGFTIPYGTHRAQWAAKGYPQQCPAQNRMRDQRPPLNVIDSAKLTFDKWKMCISNQRAGSWTTQVRTVVHFCFDIQKNFYTRSDLLLTSYLRYKDGVPLRMSDQPWNYSLQQKFGLNSLEIRR